MAIHASIWCVVLGLAVLSAATPTEQQPQGLFNTLKYGRKVAPDDRSHGFDVSPCGREARVLEGVEPSDSAVKVKFLTVSSIELTKLEAHG